MALPSMNQIRPLKLRLFLLFFLALPGITGVPMRLMGQMEGPLFQLLVWVMYCTLVQLIIIHSTSVAEWWRLFSLSSVLAMFTSLCGAVVDYLVHRNYLAAQSTVGIGYLNQGILILTVVPLGLFATGCFPMSELCARAGRHRGKRSGMYTRVILTIRVLNHISEVVASIGVVWREEMPKLVIPRAQEAKPQGGFIQMPVGVQRIYVSLLALCMALLIGVLEPFPVIVEEVESLQVAS